MTPNNVSKKKTLFSELLIPLIDINSIRTQSNFRIPVHFIFICRCALKNEVYNNSCYSYSYKVAEVDRYSEV